MDSALASFLYLYGVGGALFTASLILLFRRRALDLKSTEGRRFLVYLILGYAVFITYHAVTQFVLPGAGG